MLENGGQVPLQRWLDRFLFPQTCMRGSQERQIVE